MVSSALRGAAPRAAMLRHVLLAARAGGRPDAGGRAKLGVVARPEVAGLLFGPLGLGWSMSGRGLATTCAVLAPGGPGQDRPGGDVTTQGPGASRSAGKSAGPAVSPDPSSPGPTSPTSSLPSAAASSGEAYRRVLNLREMARQRLRSMPQATHVEKVSLKKDSMGTATLEGGGDFAFYDRNFITVMRAMQDFLLTSENLKDLRVTSRRSPNETDPPIKVYWRKDVESRSKEIWGSLDAMEKEKEKRLRKKEENVNSIMTRLIRRRKDREREERERREKEAATAWTGTKLRHGIQAESGGLDSHSGKVVLAAIGINFANFAGKLLAWFMSGSHAMFSEAVHSAADTCNQLILAFGIQRSTKGATRSHPYGYSNMQYVSSLISGVGIFCMGAGLSIYHGASGLLVQDHQFESLSLAFGILAMSFISESVTLGMAVRSLRRSAEAQGMSTPEFVLGGHDPSVNVILLEDTAAVLGVVIAAGAMVLSVQTGTHIPDAIGSILIGGLLGSVATFMIQSNTAALVGRSIPEEKLALINKELEGDIMVRQVHDVKGIDMGNGIIRYKAEVDVDGRELARYYLLQQDLPHLLDDIHSIKTEGELEVFLLKHGENIVDCLGEQVDRIELKLKMTHPEIKYVDLEVL